MLEQTLYTWVDVQEVFVQLQPDTWPTWLKWVRAYWDGLTLGVKPNQEDEIKVWLKETFAPRFDLENLSIILEEITTNTSRVLPVFLEETTDTPKTRSFVPLLTRPATLCPPSSIPNSPPPLPDTAPSLVAVHSFKGGVGRTLHALALAKGLATSRERQPVLLIDADLEAPGLSWLLKARLPEPLISLTDMLALVHGDPSPEANQSLDLLVNRLKNMLLDNIYILPAFRSNTQFTNFEIKPEHLIQHDKDPFILTKLLTRLGEKLGVQSVIVDLQAGLAEFSTGLLLDPRVYRLLVTTLSDQSIIGTSQVLSLMAHLAPSQKDDHPLPNLIVSQIPRVSGIDQTIKLTEEKLLDASNGLVQPDTNEANNINSIEDITVIKTYFDNNLLILPPEWDDVLSLLEKSGIVTEMEALLNWLPNKTLSLELFPLESLKQKRQTLAKFTQKLIYGEEQTGTDLFNTSALQHLATDFKTTIPVVVIVGAKGSGKTYTFLQIVYQQKWQNFIKTINNTSFSDEEIHVIPVLKSGNLTSEAVSKRIEETKTESAKALTQTTPQIFVKIDDYIRNNLKHEANESDWRAYWLNTIAWSAGYNLDSKTAGQDFIQFLRTQNKRAVGIIDGLEDIFQDFITDRQQQIALRSLLQVVPAWLEQEPGRPLGLVTFIRRDLVLNAIKQNSGQFLNRYQPYHLRWDWDEALQLVAWIIEKANIFSVNDFESRDLKSKLELLWGQKLGKDNSREAYTTRWVLAALSDLNGQIQARDLVRFLHEVAKNSATDTYWHDRLLPPVTMRKAVKPCSREKIKEIGTENQKLKDIFTRLQGLSSNKKQIPFNIEDVKLSIDDIKILDENGVILQKESGYVMPELFRLGLGFDLQGRGRSPVVNYFPNLKDWS